MEDSKISVEATSGDYSETAYAEMSILEKHEWSQKMERIQAYGKIVAKRMNEEGHQLVMRVLAPKEIQLTDAVALRAVGFNADWRAATRIEMVESANDIYTKAWSLGPVDKALPEILAQIIEGKGLYEHSIGELFQLYGEFEGKYQVASDTEAKMMDFVNGDERWLKDYREGNKTRRVPLPYAQKHPAHVNNPNTLDPVHRTSLVDSNKWDAARLPHTPRIAPRQRHVSPTPRYVE